MRFWLKHISSIISTGQGTIENARTLLFYRQLSLMICTRLKRSVRGNPTRTDPVSRTGGPTLKLGDSRREDGDRGEPTNPTVTFAMPANTFSPSHSRTLRNYCNHQIFHEISCLGREMTSYSILCLCRSNGIGGY